MPRNSAGTYTLPAGNPVVAGTTIDASWANDTMSDMANELTNSLSRTGAGGMLAPFRVADGSVTAPGLGFTNETNTGLYRAGTGELWLTVGGVAVAQITANGLLIPSGKRISVPTPVNASDATPKSYVDVLIGYADFYLGPKSSDPSVNNSGGALTEGATYWSTTLDQMRVYNGTTWEPMPSTASLQGQTFSGTGAQTVYTLAAPTGNATNLEVFISGVRQVPTTDYTVSGTTLTFTSAPPLGTNNIYVRFAQLIALASADSSNISYLPASGSATDVQTRLRAYEASGGSNLIGFLQAGTGAGTRTAQAKMRESVSIEDFGADGTSAGDSAALRAAIAYAATLDIPVLMPARRIYYDGAAITNDKVRLWGRGMPSVNSGKTALTGTGTIIEGKLVFSGSYIDLRDFGVDLGTAGTGPDADGIKCTSAVYNAGEHLHTENLIALCKNKTSTFHALLFEGYKKHTGGNIVGIHGYFGCVLKTRGVQLTSIQTDTNNETGVYLKSDNTYGQCSNVQIGSIWTKAADQFGVRVQSDSALLENVQIGRVHGSDHGRTICVQVLNNAGAEVRNVHIGDIVSERAATADFSALSQRSGSAIFDVGFETLTSITPTAKVVEASCEAGAAINHLYGGRVYGSYALGAAQATMDDAIYISAGVNSTNFREVEIVEAYGVGSKIGAVNYQNNADPKFNIIGAHRSKVIGTGRPNPGNLNQTLSGATATLLVPENTSGDGISFVRITISADTTVTTILPELTGSTFPLGYVLYIYNNSFFNLTINNGGNVINSGYGNVTIAQLEVAAWVWAGSAWHQLK